MVNYAEKAKTFTNEKLAEEINRTRFLLNKYIDFTLAAIGSANHASLQHSTEELQERYTAYQAELDKRHPSSS